MRLPHRRQQQPRHQDVGYSRTVVYSNSDTFALITQRFGSIAGKVFPYCVANVLLSVLLVWLMETRGLDLSIDVFGHEFMSVLVAFLVINKLSFTLGLYYEMQGHLAKLNQSALELCQLACSYTSTCLYKDEPEVKAWRFQIHLHVLILLKAVVSVLYRGGEISAWEIPELADHPLVDLSGVSGVTDQGYIWSSHLKSNKNLRVPIQLAQRLRNEIVKHRTLFPPGQDPALDMMQEQALLTCVHDFMEGYHGIRKYLVAPLPLPLVQLARIFVLVYVYTFPFALLNPQLNLPYTEMIFLTSLMTYGFIGIEYLYVELDDSFNEDPNDLPLTEEAKATAEDILLTLCQIDGRAAVEVLQASVDLSLLEGRTSSYKEQDETSYNGTTAATTNAQQSPPKETDPLV